MIESKLECERENSEAREPLTEIQPLPHLQFSRRARCDKIALGGDRFDRVVVRPEASHREIILQTSTDVNRIDRERMTHLPMRQRL